MFHAPWSRKEVKLLVFDRLSQWLLDTELMKSFMGLVEITTNMILTFGYIIIAASVVMSGYLTFKVIKLMFKICIFINLIIGILINIMNYVIKFIKFMKDITTPRSYTKE
jgi:hypothetical protein